MRTLKKDDIVEIIREEWRAKLDLLREKIETDFKINGVVKDVITTGLKVKKSSTGQLYTVVAVSVNEIELETPEKETFVIAREELENDYEVA